MTACCDDIAGLCEVCSSIESYLMAFPAHKRGSLQLLVSLQDSTLFLLEFISQQLTRPIVPRRSLSLPVIVSITLVALSLSADS